MRSGEFKGNEYILGDATLSKLFCFPSGKDSTPKGKNLEGKNLGSNFFL